MDITGYFILATTGFVGIVVLAIIINLFAMKFPFIKISERRSSGYNKRLEEYDMLLVGEVHPFPLYKDRPPYKTLFEKELKDELYLIEKSKPDYLLIEDLEHTDQQIIEAGKKVGAKLVEADVSDARDKLYKLVYKTSLFATLIDFLSTYKRTGKEKYLSIANRFLEDHSYLLGIKPDVPISAQNVSDVYKALAYYLGAAKEKLRKAEPYLNTEREMRMGEVAGKIHRENPDAKLMMIVGARHALPYTKLLDTLGKYEIKYKVESVGKGIKKKEESMAKKKSGKTFIEEIEELLEEKINR